MTEIVNKSDDMTDQNRKQSFHFKQCRKWTQIIDNYNHYKGYNKHNNKKIPYFSKKNFTIMAEIAQFAEMSEAELLDTHNKARKSRDYLVQQYIPFAKKVLNLFKQRYSVELDNDILYNAALLGLTKAIEGFAPEKLNKLITYAKDKIWRELQIALYREQDNLIAIPRHRRESAQYSTPSFHIVSIDTHLDPYSDQEGTSLDEITELQPLWNLYPSPEQQAVYEERRQTVQNLITHLTPVEQELVVQIYGIDGNTPKTITDYAAQTKTTPNNISQKHKRILAKLHKIAQENNIQPEIDEFQ